MQSDFLGPKAAEYLARHGHSEWVTNSGWLVQTTLDKLGLTLLRRLEGGQLAAVLLCENSLGERVVVKAAPSGFTRTQLDVMQAAAGINFPKIVFSDEETNTYVMEFIESPVIDALPPFAEVAALIKSWVAIEAPTTCENILEVAKSWLEAKRAQPLDKEYSLALDKAFAIITTLPDGNGILHGDLHLGNFLRDANGSLRAIDPLGYAGRAAFDAATMAIKVGKGAEDGLRVATGLGEAIGALEETLSWYKLRLANQACYYHIQRQFARAETALGWFKLAIGS